MRTAGRGANGRLAVRLAVVQLNPVATLPAQLLAASRILCQGELKPPLPKRFCDGFIAEVEAGELL